MKGPINAMSHEVCHEIFSICYINATCHPRFSWIHFASEFLLHAYIKGPINACYTRFVMKCFQ